MTTTLNREVDSSMSSFWISKHGSTSYTISAEPIESDIDLQLVDALLNEFVHSTEEEKVEFKSMLETWLDEMDDEDLEMGKVEKVRDLIYEMF